MGKEDLIEAGIGCLVSTASSNKHKLRATAVLAVGFITVGARLLFFSGQPEASATNVDIPFKSGDSEADYIESFLKTPGPNGELSVWDRVEETGASLYVRPVLGKRDKVASAGPDGLLQRPVPHRDSEEFPEEGYLNYGDCFTWGENEVIVMNQDGTTDLFAPLLHGYFPRLHTAQPNGDTKWYILLGDPRCEDYYPKLPDDSRIFNPQMNIIGPTPIEADRFNSKSYK